LSRLRTSLVDCCSTPRFGYPLCRRRACVRLLPRLFCWYVEGLLCTVCATPPTQCLVAGFLRFRDIDNKRYAHLPARGTFCFLECALTKHHNTVGIRNEIILFVSLLPPRMTLFIVCFIISFVSQLTACIVPYVPGR
jgi:hypothetical protein